MSFVSIAKIQNNLHMRKKEQEKRACFHFFYSKKVVFPIFCLTLDMK